MFKYCSLYSGSSGNCFFIQSDNTKLLIDAGVSCKKIVTSLSNLNVDINDINAILVTHEHIDHTKGLSAISNKYNIPIYLNAKTFAALNDMSNKINIDHIILFKTTERFKIGDLYVSSFPIPHDAADPCGFNIYCNNKKISVATDIGYVSEKLLEYLKHSNSILLESNYDPEILKYSSYPYLLKKRISGNTGHLSNEIAGKTLATLYNFGLSNAILIHLSKENNFPELAYQTILNEVLNCNNFSLDIAPRNSTSKIFDVT